MLASGLPSRIGSPSAVIATGFAARSGISKSELSSAVLSNIDWIVDSGASDHVSCDRDKFVNFSTSFLTKTVLLTADGDTSKVVGIGSIPISNTVILENVLYVPTLSCNLLSVSQITRALNCTVSFSSSVCRFQDNKNLEMIGSGRQKDGLYYLDDSPGSSSSVVLFASKNNIDKNRLSVLLWHNRLGHPSFGYIKHLFPSLFDGLSLSEFVCETCILAKNKRNIFPQSDSVSMLPFDLVHTDVWGPAPTHTHNGMRWFISFIDDYSRVTWIFLMKQKSEVPYVIRNFLAMVHTQFHTTVRVLRSDNGGEYISNDLKQFLSEKGIIHQTTCVYSPQQNGTAERKNQHILNITRSLLLSSNVPICFWGEAVLSAVYVLNRTPSKVLGFETPLHKLSTKHALPSVVHLPPRVFGCVCYVHVHSHLRNKFNARALKCVFLGYGVQTKGYRAYHPESKRMFVSVDCVFHEQSFFYIPTVPPLQEGTESEVDGSKKQLDVMLFDMVLQNESTGQEGSDVGSRAGMISPDAQSRPLSPDQVCISVPEIIAKPSTSEISDSASQPETVEIIEPEPEPSIGYSLPPRVNRGKPPIRYEPDLSSKSKYPIANCVSTHRLSRSYALFVSTLSSVSIPKNVQEALEDTRWTGAMGEEMEALEKNCTWSLCDLPEGKKPVGCKWVYVVKYDADGSVERFKARLVAKGYTQTYGIDYQETFAPVAKLNTVRILLSLAATKDWPLLQFDVKNAFLHGELAEDVYMELPPGVKKYEGCNKVCKLNKALYGLKQSPRAWFGRFTKAMLSFGYCQSNADHTLFLKRNGNFITCLIIYVDDMILTGNDEVEIGLVQEYLASEFEMKQLGNLKYFLGIEVARSKDGIFLSQRKYVLDLLAESGMIDCYPVDTPVEQNLKLSLGADGDVKVDQGQYQRLVGKLIYLAHTRPDIAFAVNVISQYMHDPRESHLAAVRRILRYLKGCPGRGVLFSNHGHLQVEGHTDANWAGCVDDRRSTSGYFVFVGGNLVTWRSKKQSVVSRSSAEAEFRGMALGICELLWVKKLLTDMGFELQTPMKLFCDNKSAIEIASNPVQHDRTKHIEIDRFFIKEQLESKVIELPFVRSEQQLADVLTKGVSTRVFSASVSKLGMKDIYAPP